MPIEVSFVSTESDGGVDCLDQRLRLHFTDQIPGHLIASSRLPGGWIRKRPPVKSEMTAQLWLVVDQQNFSAGLGGSPGRR